MHLTPEAPRSSIRALEDYSRTLGSFKSASPSGFKVNRCRPPRGAMSGGYRTHDRCPMAPRGCGRRSRRPQGVGSSGVKCIPRPRDSHEAAKWYRVLAERRGLPESDLPSRARHNLGELYRSGDGVPQDPVLAYFWNSLAVAEGNFFALRSCEELKRSLSWQEIAEAQRLTREWKPKTWAQLRAEFASD